MSADEYAAIRALVVSAGFASDVNWSEGVAAPDTPSALWCEYGWVVVNSGMRATVAQAIWTKIYAAIERGDTAASVFGHAAKAAAIDDFWMRRTDRLAAFQALVSDDARLEWCVSLPWIGPITKYHLAKNLGVDCAKPDRWLARVALAANESVDALCARLARATGDRIATVDLVIWRACEQGLWRPAVAA